MEIVYSQRNNHTHCQAPQTSRTSQSLSKSVSEPTLTDSRTKKSTIAQQWLYVMRAKVLI